jgi:chorismate mutase
MSPKPDQEFSPFAGSIGQHPLTLIAGPCSAESRDQVLSTARGIAANFPHAIFRAGVWKPRTRPGTFEGMGAPALEWLKEVKSETNLLVAIEVANAGHVQEALKAGIDILWIGARTVVNPFSVQEIADAIQGTGVPVLVKNPIHPDIDLWVGAIERVLKAGSLKVAAVHRGFHQYLKTQYRNPPQWEIPIRLKEIFPQIQVFCDPSHIGGKPELIESIAQKALDLGMEGLMIETHCQPEFALSDAHQQVSPYLLNQIIQHLEIRQSPETSENLLCEIDAIRAKIDRIDDELLLMLAERMKASKEIGEFKKEHNISILQIKRWRKIIRKALKEGNNLGLQPDFIKAVYQLIHEESIRIQSDVLKKKVNPLKELPF